MLQLFFEGVQAKVAQGVKESEISYQMAYSKPELRKVIREYPAREVKKGLDSLYRKVEKHLCEEENLLQVCFFLCVYTYVHVHAYFWVDVGVRGHTYMNLPYLTPLPPLSLAVKACGFYSNDILHSCKVNSLMSVRYV